MTEFDTAKISWQDQYKLMIGTVTPRPIALVTTLGRNGPNAAPFSFFNAVGSDPAMLMFSVGDKSGAAKDTVRNIREIPEFVVHIVSDAIKEQMNVCAVDYPPEINEIEKAGLTAVPSTRVRPPRIAEAPVATVSSMSDFMSISVASTRSGGWPARGATPASPIVSRCRASRMARLPENDPQTTP
jgi:flavin reductase (DIM6/NTAB) family NADH-FMN oxidoreductase RutF